MFERAALVRVLPFALYLSFILIDDMLRRFGWPAHALRWLYGIKIGAVLTVLIACRRHYGELRWVRPSPRGLLLSLLTGLLVLVLWVKLDAGWMSIGSSAGFDPRGDGGIIDWRLVAMRIAGAALVVPVMEELFWRSFLMRWIDAPDFLKRAPAQVSARAFAVSVLLFGFEHNLWLAGLVAGAAYSVLYMRSQSLWPPIIAHAVTNAGLGVWIVTTGHWTYW
ncbi:CAAX prenyl protease-related protein [Janthinobacterium agaricidamnosum]|uniref:CAAX amino terminal protease family protein n=1 Tax=Janthinobacterium agaricidamnosum NBRC 102515 = DSM 9628 TaxID=1349767 RepID=W0VBG6_9BURK|nr:CAAX prenyl protease-related protein [Janthinobacterium agaricidamnosum]CDG84617.1 CAAX amino terminal protease family protein [Janthinobacterium agaricidamnosum NBRC 102515 = DSM 9628]